MRRLKIGALVAGMASLGDGFASLADGIVSILGAATPPQRYRSERRTIGQTLAADRAALAQDWDKVAGDLRRAGLGSPSPLEVSRPTKGRTLK